MGRQQDIFRIDRNLMSSSFCVEGIALQFAGDRGGQLFPGERCGHGKAERGFGQALPDLDRLRKSAFRVGRLFPKGYFGMSTQSETQPDSGSVDIWLRCLPGARRDHKPTLAAVTGIKIMRLAQIGLRLAGGLLDKIVILQSVVQSALQLRNGVFQLTTDQVVNRDCAEILDRNFRFEQIQRNGKIWGQPPVRPKHGFARDRGVGTEIGVGTERDVGLPGDLA